ncbi:AC9 transposase [Actinidia chinensis var. chinensis]|uniref:AC9 transposase n=1 Tax=Actinidia chinensis var. chinensis TaxID=1590841 RepID=A0A2R6QHM0_ACTCC|nr:AC9 transposase [Actinidia chinensis var. chinensis]
MVSRNTIKKDILKIYDVEKVKTMAVMERIQSRAAMTTDMWTSSNQKRGFMVVTTHFIDDSWKLQSRIIRFIYVPCPHTAEVLCDALMDTFLEWNIDRKLSTLTIDNCSTNDAMISLLLKKFKNGVHLWTKNLFHVRCVAHILNLIVKDGLEIYETDSWLMIEKVRTLCYDLLTEYQGKNNNSGGESLNRATSTLGGKDALSNFDLFVSKRKKGKASHVKSELDHYLEEDVLPRNQNFDILAWWKSNGLKYPALQTIAKDVLSVPVSTAVSESAFSTNGRVVSPNRSKFHPKTLEALMCAQS